MWHWTVVHLPTYIPNKLYEILSAYNYVAEDVSIPECVCH